MRPLRHAGSRRPTESDKSITVAVIGRVRLYRESLVQSLSQHRQMIVLDLGAGDHGSLVRFAQLHPDVVLINLPATYAATVIQALTATVPGLRILALPPEDSEVTTVTLLEAGLSGFVPEDASVGDVVRSIEEAMRGELQLPQRIVDALVARLRTPTRGHSGAAPHPQLTQRETEIVGLLAHHMTNKEIAARLRIEPSTVKNHVHRILRKWSIHRRVEVAAMAGDFVASIQIVSGKQEDK